MHVLPHCRVRSARGRRWPAAAGCWPVGLGGMRATGSPRDQGYMYAHSLDAELNAKVWKHVKSRIELLIL